MRTFPMTINGAKQLQDELERLKTIERPAVIAAIAEARSHGDLSENAEYDAAKNKQAFIEGRIADIEAKLSRSEIIDPSTINSDGRVVFGATVSLLDLDNELKISYQIVGDDEADIKQSKISVNSPVAKSLIGKKIGSIVEVHAPSGVKEYEILGFFL
ncbi:MAG: transcription elongation factor GreA [Proteobacteria bacterium]|jgi:transcription elongation factor GreA|nr:transcription elongation factor GreA [Pseudomonadota bacterium]